MLRKKQLLSLLAALPLAVMPHLAHAGDQRWLSLSASSRALVDRLAGEIYAEEAASAGYNNNSEYYAQWAPADRARYRAERRRDWRGGNGNAGANFGNLSPAQKAPFRQRAMDILGAQSPNYYPAGDGRDI